MPKFQNAAFFGFKGGLNTTSSPLNTPPEDSVDISNVVLGVDGSISRRKGIQYIGGDTISSNITDYSTIADGQNYTESSSGFEFTPTINNNTIIRFIMIHVGTDLRIYDYNSYRNLKDLATTFGNIDLSSYGDEQALYKTTFVQDRNRVYVINQALPYLYIEYNKDTNAFEVNFGNIFIRDFELQTPAVDSVVRHNGASYVCIKSHDGTAANEPGVGESWRNVWVYTGLETGAETPWALVNNATFVNYTQVLSIADDVTSSITRTYRCIQTHNSNFTLIPYRRAEYWEDLGYHDPAYADWDGNDISYTASTGSETGYSSNVTPLTFDSGKGFSTATSSSGRLWLGGSVDNSNTIYFSRTLALRDRTFEQMYQFADPYSKTDSAIVATDGGAITITGMEKLLKLVSFNEGVLVIATNGIWQITGTDGFNPTNYLINKVSDVGAISPDGVINAEGSVIYFGRDDVYVVSSKTDILGKPDALVLSLKITNFYNSLTYNNRATGKAIYSPAEKKAYFFTNFDNYDWQVDKNKYNTSCRYRDALIYDFRLQSWYKYSLNTDELGTNTFINDVFLVTTNTTTEIDVVDSLDNNVVDFVGNLLIAEDTLGKGRSTSLQLTLMKESGTTYDWGFGTLEGDGFSDLDGETYSSFVTFAHQTFNDLAHTKYMPYLIPVFKRVEDNVLDAEGFDTNQGACKYRVDWNWSVNSNSSKFGVLRDAYFPNRITTGHFSGVDPGYEVVSSRLKVRGSGDVMRVHFESVEDYDFYLYGTQLLVHAKGTV